VPPRRRDALVATLDTGAKLDAELVIVAAGVRPNIGFLRGSGIDCGTGITIDDSMRTNLPDVYAAGDVAEGIDPSTGKRVVNAIQRPRSSRRAWPR